MKIKHYAIAVVLFAFCRAGFAVSIFTFTIYAEHPQDNREARAHVCDRPELKPLHAAYTNTIQTQLCPLKFDQLAKIFGPKLDTATNRAGLGVDEKDKISGPELGHHPADLVLPIFAPGGWINCNGTMVMMVFSLRFYDPAKNNRHTDLYAVGDLGYVELYSQLDGEKVQTAVIYLRTDDKFVPLKSTNDFSKRLEWEKGKFETLKKWLDAHLVSVGEPDKLSPNAPSQRAK